MLSTGAGRWYLIPPLLFSVDASSSLEAECGHYCPQCPFSFRWRRAAEPGPEELSCDVEVGRMKHFHSLVQQVLPHRRTAIKEETHCSGSAEEEGQLLSGLGVCQISVSIKVSDPPRYTSPVCRKTDTVVSSHIHTPVLHLPPPFPVITIWSTSLTSAGVEFLSDPSDFTWTPSI